MTKKRKEHPEEFQQLSFNIDVPEQPTTNSEAPQTTSDTPEPAQPTEAPQTTPESTALSVTKESFNVMPNTLQAAAESSMSLRSIQVNLANILTSDAYLSTIATTAPDVLPSLMVSLTNAVATADNLLIRMAQVSEKSSSMKRAFDYLTRQKEQLTDAQSNLEKKDPMYDETVDRIKKAIYRNLDAQRDSEHKSASNYIDENDVKPHDVIDAEYTVADDSDKPKDDFSDVPEE